MRELGLHLALSAIAIVGAIQASRARRLGALGVSFVAAAATATVVAPPVVFPEGAPMFAAMRVLAGVLFLELPLVLGVVAVLAPRAWRVRRVLAAVMAVMLEMVAIDAFLVEPRALTVRHETVVSPRLSARLRIVVLSDVQTDAPGAYEERVVRVARSLRPDLVLLPGDYVQLPEGAAYREASRRLGAMLDTLRPSLGTYAVRGNVEHEDFVEDLFAGTRVRAFDETTRVPLGPVDLVALSFDDSFDTGLVVPASDRFQIVFGHGPDFMLGDVRADLSVAGHTHGGQVSVPFFGPPLTLSSVPRLWGRGGHHVSSEGRHIDVSRGIGMERDAAPRLRFLCRPEIVVLDLVPG